MVCPFNTYTRRSTFPTSSDIESVHRKGRGDNHFRSQPLVATMFLSRAWLHGTTVRSSMRRLTSVRSQWLRVLNFHVYCFASHQIHPYEERKAQQTCLFATVSKLCQGHGQQPAPLPVALQRHQYAKCAKQLGTPHYPCDRFSATQAKPSTTT